MKIFKISKIVIKMSLILKIQLIFIKIQPCKRNTPKIHNQHLFITIQTRMLKAHSKTKTGTKFLNKNFKKTKIFTKKSNLIKDISNMTNCKCSNSKTWWAVSLTMTFTKSAWVRIISDKIKKSKRCRQMKTIQLFLRIIALSEGGILRMMRSFPFLRRRFFFKSLNSWFKKLRQVEGNRSRMHSLLREWSLTSSHKGSRAIMKALHL